LGIKSNITSFGGAAKKKYVAEFGTQKISYLETALYASDVSITKLKFKKLSKKEIYRYFELTTFFKMSIRFTRSSHYN